MFKMNPSKTALASLTATYSDSDVDNEETNMDIESTNDTTPEKVDPPRSVVDEIKKVSSKTKLVSYNVDNDEKAASDYQSDSDMSTNNDSSDDELPPRPKGRCVPELQEKVNSLYDKVKNEGINMNKFIQERKAFRNPSIYEKLIEYCNLNEYGTNFPPHIYDPTRWGKESYYDELAKVQKAEMEKREKERKEKTKVEIVSGTAKHITATNSNNNSSVSNIPTVTRTLLDAAETSKRRKTKWDQVGMNTASSINSSVTLGIQSVTNSASGTKGTIIPAFGNLPKKPKA